MPTNFVNVKVPGLSGFDKSFHNMLTTKVGTLTPILVDEVIPGSVIDLKSAISAALPPLASDTFMNVNLKIEAFFVPTRLLYGGYEAWLTGSDVYDPEDDTVTRPLIPVGKITYNDQVAGVTGPGTLSDFLGINADLGLSSGEWAKVNIFPYLCYHRIYNDWYRNAKIQAPVFTSPGVNSMASSGALYLNQIFLPYISLTLSGDEFISLSSYLNDGVKICDLRQRNFGFDYFTSAFADAQLGQAKNVSFQVDSQGKGAFTIAALRAQNSLQQFSERNQLGSPRMQDYVHTNYGASLADGVAQRAVYLGSDSIPVYTKSVSQQGVAPQISNNPFDAVAAQYGDGKASGQVGLVNNFKVNEPGYFMVLASLVPEVTYVNGFARYLKRYTEQDSQVDLANPLLQNVGNQPIFQYELNSQKQDTIDVFGFTERYADWKVMLDQVHGLLKPSQTLESFALTRQVTGTPLINSAFLKIPTNYMDHVTAVTADLSEYGVWIDCYHDYRVSMPLSPYSIPSLQDPAYEHGKDVNVHLNGSML